MHKPIRGFLPLFFSLISLAAVGQAPVPGYVVTAGQDSLRGAIHVQDDYAQQGRVDFVPLQGNQRLLLDAYQVKSYGYIRKQDTVRYVSVPMRFDPRSDKAGRLFLRQLASGPVELYQYYFSNKYVGATFMNPGTTTQPPTATQAAHPQLNRPRFIAPQAGQGKPFYGPLSTNSALLGSGNALLLHQRAKNILTETTWWSFPADAVTYFADCPALVSDLQAKHYRPRDLPRMVRRYNAWLATAATGR